MSPEVVVEDIVGNAILRAEFPDAVGSYFKVSDGTRATVATVESKGVVAFTSNLLKGAYEPNSEGCLNGEGLRLDFQRREWRQFLGEVDGEMTLMRITAKPSTNGASKGL